MPSPFPGMDPYLEERALWRGVHQGLIFAINQQLNAVLPPGFSANMEERVYIAGPDFGTFPDILVREEPPTTDGEPLRAGGGVTAVANRPVAAASPAPRHVTILPERARELYVEVLQHETDTVVAVVEVLSPGNKAGGAGREEYQRKQRALLDSAAHLVEIDLLRAGQHTIVVPPTALRPGDPREYRVCLHRGGQPADGTTLHQCDFWPLGLRGRLPQILLPLTPGVPEVSVDLQTAFTQMYDAGPYRRRIRYSAPPPDPPLSAEDAAWADALLREKGLRP